MSNKTNNKIKLTITVALMVVVMIGISYGAFFVLRNQTDENTIATGCFSTTFTEETSSINLQNAVPLSDDAALSSLTPYTFTLSNTCSLASKYTVIMSIKTGSIPTNRLKLSVNKQTPVLLSTLTPYTSVPSGYASSFVIMTNVMQIKQSKTFKIYLWLDEITQYSEVTGKSLDAKIEIINTPTNLDTKVLSQAGNKLALGDKIAIGDQNFWVISNNNGKIRALAEYNLYVGSIYDSGGTKIRDISNSEAGYGLQNSDAKGFVSGANRVGTVPFASPTQHGTNNSSYEGSILQSYINNYISTINNIYGTSVIGDAITKEELESPLGCSSSSYTCNNSSYSWVKTTTYWSGSAFSPDSVWVVDSTGNFGNGSYSSGSYFGVRPVIEIDEAALPKKVYTKILLQAGGSLALGDKIAIGNQNFWVISNTSGTVRAIAEYNLYVGRIYDSSGTKLSDISNSEAGYGLQNMNAKGYVSGANSVGTVPFASTTQHGTNNSSYEGSILQSYINAYVTLLNSTYGTNITGDAITHDELTNIFECEEYDSCPGTVGTTDTSWVYTTSYWSGSARNASDVWYVFLYGNFDNSSYPIDYNFGVRPVIEIDESDIPGYTPTTRIISKAGSNLATGDKIAIGDENFWVISNISGTVRALAEYNLYVGSIYNSSGTKIRDISSSEAGYGLQNSNAKGSVSGANKVATVPFASTTQHGTNYSSYEGSILQSYINNYISTINNIYGTNVTGDAITKEELESPLGCAGSSFYTCNNSNYSWVKTTSYWSGSAYDSYDVWGVFAYGRFDIYYYTIDYYFGVRPVIVISESSI